MKIQNYRQMDCMKFAAALMVICVHTRHNASEVWFDFFIQNILCRVAVPFFFISSAFFIRKKSLEDPTYLRMKLSSLFTNYLFWSVVYILIGLFWINQNMDLDKVLYPFVLLFGIFYCGTYYHLWYIPALLFSLLVVTKLLHRFSYKIIFVFLGFFYLLGSLETYYSLIPNSVMKHFFDTYISVLFTTRNGLFYAPIFIACGFYIYDNKEKLIKLGHSIRYLLLLMVLLLIAEGYFIFRYSDYLDCNFILMLVPVSFLLFTLGIQSTIPISFKTNRIRLLTQYYYFIHIISIVLIAEIGHYMNWRFLEEGLSSFAFAALLTHYLSLQIIKIKESPLSKTVWSFSLFVSFFLTGILTALLLHSKGSFSPVHIEVYPCMFICILIFISPIVGSMKTSTSLKKTISR
ncbi:acyltransferase family protein [Candidatus Enterococcus murrayae]|uniref:Acyltransferase family protein n=1 Tax=Candidatus Enterococcus murrayae TaxID=2815321 RepID=A0ABS3HNS0_9ENTE|nr:acyltransferase family protein [Enterococcus sp. MJM16]MBO0455106.1 acyltransferase family protein [Enterococcus sp. MJM16]